MSNSYINHDNDIINFTDLDLTMKELKRCITSKGNILFISEPISSRLFYRIQVRRVQKHRNDIINNIDKDYNPKWIPDRLEDVDNNIVMSHFESLGNNDLKFN